MKTLSLLPRNKNRGNKASVFIGWPEEAHSSIFRLQCRPVPTPVPVLGWGDGKGGERCEWGLNLDYTSLLPSQPHFLCDAPTRKQWPFFNVRSLKWPKEKSCGSVREQFWNPWTLCTFIQICTRRERCFKKKEKKKGLSGFLWKVVRERKLLRGGKCKSLSHRSVPDDSGLVRPLGKQKEGKINTNGRKKHVPDLSSLCIKFIFICNRKAKWEFLWALTWRMTPFSSRLCFFAVITK